MVCQFLLSLTVMYFQFEVLLLSTANLHLSYPADPTGKIYKIEYFQFLQWLPLKFLEQCCMMKAQVCKSDITIVSYDC